MRFLSEYVQILQITPWTYTPPLPLPGRTEEQGDYLNFLVDAASRHAPDVLYSHIREIEDLLGHNRRETWASREIDIDILLWALNHDPAFSNCPPLQYDDPAGLKVPHVDTWERSFWTTPLREVFAVLA